MVRGPGGVVVRLLETWRTSADVADDVRCIDDPTRPMESRLVAIGRTSLDELDAHRAASSLLWRARVRSSRGQLTVPASLRTLSALAAPAVVVLSAVVEASGALGAGEIFARFALSPSDATWIVEAAVIASCLALLVQRRLVERVGELLRASANVRARCA